MAAEKLVAQKPVGQRQTAADIDAALSRIPRQERPKVIASSKPAPVYNDAGPSLATLASEAVLAYATDYYKGREAGPEDVRGVVALAHIKLLWDAVELVLTPEQERAIRQRLVRLRETGVL